jgi:hypothetical protein
MGLVSKVIDKLPTWVQAILMVLVAAGSLHYIAHYGVGHFLLHMIFGPEP